MRLTRTVMVTIAKNLASTVTLSDGNVMPMFGLGMFLTKTDEDTAKTAVSHALKNGYKLIDTAEFYGNERDVGAGIKNSGVKREDVFVVTKLWDLGYKRCRDAFTASLEKLDTGYVDLYLIHYPAVGKVVESYKAMLELQQQGLIRSVGVSNFDVHHLEGLKEAGLPMPAVNQVELHPWMKRRELVDYCHNNNIAAMGYAPMMKGQRFDDPVLLQIAKRVGRTTAEVLIRYSVQMGYITIPKSDKPARIEENAKVFEWELSQADMDELNSFPEASCLEQWSPWTAPWKG